VVDAVYTLEYAYNGLYFTSILYAVFTAIAIRGWFRWNAELNTEMSLLK
jgi:nicotinamide mononucleotide transporter